jgi:hypothetical protein
MRQGRKVALDHLGAVFEGLRERGERWWRAHLREHLTVGSWQTAQREGAMPWGAVALEELRVRKRGSLQALYPPPPSLRTSAGRFWITMIRVEGL